MKKLVLFLLVSLSFINLTAQGRRGHDNIFRNISTDIFGSLIYNHSGMSAKLEKDIFDTVEYSDNKGNRAKYSEEQWAKLVSEFENDRKACFVWLIESHSRSENYQTEHSMDIFGNEVHKDNDGNSEVYKKDIFENLVYENGRGVKATLKKDIFNAVEYSDNKGNRAKYSKEQWGKLVFKFDNDRDACFAWLIESHSRSENKRTEHSIDIFGNEVNKDSEGVSEVYKRDIFDNLIYENNNGVRATLKKDIFDCWSYSDNKGNGEKYDDREWGRLIRKYKTEEAIFKRLVNRYLKSKR